MNIFVARLSSGTSSEDLNSLFSQFGAVTSAKVIMDRETGFSKRYGFVEMENDAEARMAIEQLNDSEVDGSQIAVKEARPKEERPRSNFGDRRGGGGGGYGDRRGGGGGYGGGGGGYGDRRGGGGGGGYGDRNTGDRPRGDRNDRGGERRGEFRQRDDFRRKDDWNE